MSGRYLSQNEAWAAEREAMRARESRRANRAPLTVGEIVALALIGALVVFGPVMAWAVAR